MVLMVPITPDTEAKLKARAATAGVDVETFAARELQRLARGIPSLEELSGPVADAFAQSGMSEDELAEFLEEEKHALRAERRARRDQ